MFVEDGACLEWAYSPENMNNKHNHVSITRNLGIVDISEEDFINKIYEIHKMRSEYLINNVVQRTTLFLGSFNA